MRAAVAAMGMMQMAVHEIVDMVAMRDGVVPAAGAVNMPRLMTSTAMLRRADVGVRWRRKFWGGGAMISVLPVITLTMSASAHRDTWIDLRPKGEHAAPRHRPDHRGGARVPTVLLCVLLLTACSSAPPAPDTATAERLNAARANITPPLGATVYTLDQERLQSQPGGENRPFTSTLTQLPGVTRGPNGQVFVRGQ